MNRAYGCKGLNLKDAGGQNRTADTRIFSPLLEVCHLLPSLYSLEFTGRVGTHLFPSFDHKVGQKQETEIKWWYDNGAPSEVYSGFSNARMVTEMRRSRNVADFGTS